MTPHEGGWYYLTMSDPRYIRDICTRVLREARQKVGFSQRALAVASGVSLSTIAKAEQGRQNLSMDTLVRLMDAMGMALVIRTRFRSASEIGTGMIPYQDVSMDVSLHNTEDVRPHDMDDHPPKHEEDDAPDSTNAPDPGDKTEEELEQEIIREITRAR